MTLTHGELITISAYVAYFLSEIGHPFWSNWWVLAAAIIITSVVFAVATDFVAFRRVRGSSDFTMLLTSFGLVIFVRAAFSHWVELKPRNFDKATWIFDTVEIAGIRIEVYDLAVIAITVITLIALTIILQRTMFGLSLRAASEDFDAARLMGINSDRVIRNAFALSGLLAGIGGTMLLLRRGQAEPGMGIEILLIPLLATVIGGLGSLKGAVLGGLILGLLEVMFRGLILPDEFSHFTDLAIFILIAVLFIVRPQGLITVHRAERV
ncbi:MAG: branched-chain amino acid ABC transporter permease [Chloroflexi bacterium]|nr:branched-chain amino acid ABC transporter permease [Chloroflexota bacterium]